MSDMILVNCLGKADSVSHLIFLVVLLHPVYDPPQSYICSLSKIKTPIATLGTLTKLN